MTGNIILPNVDDDDELWVDAQEEEKEEVSRNCCSTACSMCSWFGRGIIILLKLISLEIPANTPPPTMIKWPLTVEHSSNIQLRGSNSCKIHNLYLSPFRERVRVKIKWEFSRHRTSAAAAVVLLKLWDPRNCGGGGSLSCRSNTGGTLPRCSAAGDHHW